MTTVLQEQQSDTYFAGTALISGNFPGTIQNACQCLWSLLRLGSPITVGISFIPHSIFLLDFHLPMRFQRSKLFSWLPQAMVEGIIFLKSRKAGRFQKLVKSLLYCIPSFFEWVWDIKEMAVTCCAVSDNFVLLCFNMLCGFLKYFKNPLHLLRKLNMYLIFYYELFRAYDWGGILSNTWMATNWILMPHVV